MTASAHDSPTSLDLTREEAWVVHAAVVTAVERLADDEQDPSDAVALLRSLEVDETFETGELEHLLDVLRTYLEDDAPSSDRESARRVVEAIEGALEG
ncbi:DUF7853 family protein [Halobellus sp. GM3]|uniref:DUF7853 family protein n=1 Tax=Halobellus sp. GM3 TaxID=3458410 RepID=UPI00403D9D71